MNRNPDQSDRDLRGDITDFSSEADESQGRLTAPTSSHYTLPQQPLKLVALLPQRQFKKVELPATITRLNHIGSRLHRATTEELLAHTRKFVTALDLPDIATAQPVCGAVDPTGVFEWSWDSLEAVWSAGPANDRLCRACFPAGAHLVAAGA